MKVLIVGSGGREHAICRSFAASRRVSSVFCADGNAGIRRIAECVAIKPDQITALRLFAEENSIDLTFVGGETSLALGIVDEFESKGLKIVGPSGSAARLESSKTFAKEFMARHKIPTAAFAAAECAQDAIDLLESGRMGDAHQPVVVKADGLAAGKGVVIAANRVQAVTAVSEMEALVGTAASQRIVLEECLVGKEISMLMFASGEQYAVMPAVRDHKRLGDGDTGPNTGGMGTFTDPSLLSDADIARIRSTIIEPTLSGCVQEGFPFHGILFVGLMMTADGPKVLEYNVRFGDPETQSILVRLNSDIVDICEAMLNGTLDQIQIDWKEGSSATVVLAAKGYPSSPVKGDLIAGLVDAEALENVEIFHAGTASGPRGEYHTAGGRVLGVTALGPDMETALQRAYDAAGKISFDGMQFRRDIGLTHR